MVREYIGAIGAFMIAPALYGPVTTTVEQQMKIPTSLQVCLLEVLLFGDLIAAAEQTIDGEGATAAASNPLRGASFAPGTHAQRHRVRQSGSKHGGARRVFSRPLTPLVTKFRGSSSSAD